MLHQIAQTQRFIVQNLYLTAASGDPLAQRGDLTRRNKYYTLASRPVIPGHESSLLWRQWYRETVLIYAKLALGVDISMWQNSMYKRQSYLAWTDNTFALYLFSRGILRDRLVRDQIWIATATAIRLRLILLHKTALQTDRPFSLITCRPGKYLMAFVLIHAERWLDLRFCLHYLPSTCLATCFNILFSGLRISG